MVNNVSHDILVSRLCVYKGVAHLLRDTVLFAGLYDTVDKLLVGQLDKIPLGFRVIVDKTYGTARVVAVCSKVVSHIVGGVRHVPAFISDILERLSRGGLSGHNNGKRAL